MSVSGGKAKGGINGNQLLTGNFTYNTWTHVALQYNNYTQNQVCLINVYHFFRFGSTRMFFPFPEQYGFTIRQAAIQCRYLIIIVLVNNLISNQVGHLCQSKYNPHVKSNIIVVVVVVMVAQNLKRVVGSFIVTLKLVFCHVTRTLTLIIHFVFQSDTSENFDSVLLCF